MKQQCYLWAVWLTWLGVPVIALYMGFTLGWLFAGLVIVVGVVAQIGYLRAFPYLSRLLGYGSVADKSAEAESSTPLSSKVILYTANVCPFCPIVKKRLQALQGDLGFDLQEVDVTFRPDIISTKRFLSVPVVEVNGRLLIGNSTSAELAAFLREDPEASEVK